METRPATSVIIPVFNGAAFVGEAIGSVLAQLDADDEILVVDDASTDTTAQVLAGFAPRITVLKGRGEGVSAARNLGIAAARGDFIAFLDHDDLWPAGRHRALLAALTADPDADAAVGRVRLLLEGDADIAPYRHLESGHWPGLLWSCLYRRRLIETVGAFDVTMQFGEDVDYYVRLREAGMVLAHCDVDAVVYRRHAGNASSREPSRSSTLLQTLARKVARGRARQQP